MNDPAIIVIAPVIAALGSSALTAIFVRRLTDRQIEAARDAEETRYQRDLRRERMEEVRGVLAEVQTALRAFSEFALRAEENPFEPEAELATRLGLDESPRVHFLQLLPEVVFRVPLGPIAFSWREFAQQAVEPLPDDALSRPGIIGAFNQRKILDLMVSLDGLEDAVDAYVVGDHGDQD